MGGGAEDSDGRSELKSEVEVQCSAVLRPTTTPQSFDQASMFVFNFIKNMAFEPDERGLGFGTLLIWRSISCDSPIHRVLGREGFSTGYEPALQHPSV